MSVLLTRMTGVSASNENGSVTAAPRTKYMREMLL